MKKPPEFRRPTLAQWTEAQEHFQNLFKGWIAQGMVLFLPGPPPPEGLRGRGIGELLANPKRKAKRRRGVKP